MDKEKIILGLLVVAIGALIIGNLKKVAPYQTIPTASDPNLPVANSNVPTEQNVRQSNLYTYNQNPWAFAPPVNNFMPSLVAPGGAPVNVVRAPGCVVCE